MNYSQVPDSRSSRSNYELRQCAANIPKAKYNAVARRAGLPQSPLTGRRWRVVIWLVSPGGAVIDGQFQLEYDIRLCVGTSPLRAARWRNWLVINKRATGLFSDRHVHIVERNGARRIPTSYSNTTANVSPRISLSSPALLELDRPLWNDYRGILAATLCAPFEFQTFAPRRFRPIYSSSSDDNSTQNV